MVCSGCGVWGVVGLRLSSAECCGLFLYTTCLCLRVLLFVDSDALCVVCGGMLGLYFRRVHGVMLWLASFHRLLTR